MKRSIIGLASLVALGIAIYCGSGIMAQAPAQPQARPLQTRIGLMNMVFVLKNYKKFQTIEKDIKDKSKVVEDKLRPMQKEMQDLKTQYQDGKTTAELKEKIEHRMRQLQLDYTVAEEDAKKELLKVNSEAAITIFREVKDAVDAYARSNNLELVFFYNDAITNEDFFHPANIQRKLTTPAAVMPLYVTQGMDVSNDIVNMLNAKYQGGSSAAAPAAPGVPGAPVPAPRQ